MGIGQPQDTNGQPVCDQCQLQYRGPHCDKCKDGYYSSDSICMPCECNGNVDRKTSPRVCDPDTGQCLNCSNNTAGKHCEKCAEGYVGEDCSELYTNGQPVCDQCQLQYRGPHCDKCKDGYYSSDSICMPCECNGNVDRKTSPRVCDPDTGQCLNCSNNTAGKHCEKCAEGYVGEDCSELSQHGLNGHLPPQSQSPGRGGSTVSMGVAMVGGPAPPNSSWPAAPSSGAPTTHYPATKVRLGELVP
ncbi:UNVERIFIED_CONTAM: hypothetical protein FKN15_006010 [Acipenser sinensis]